MHQRGARRPQWQAQSSVEGVFPRFTGMRKMTFVYSRVGALTAAGMAGQADSGWLYGASVRGLPYRLAWVANAVRSGDIWREMAFTAPVPQRQGPRRAGQEAYILQQDPNGLWFVDPWAGNGAGTIRPARPSLPVDAVSSSRDLADTCFIIELDRATHP